MRHIKIGIALFVSVLFVGIAGAATTVEANEIYSIDINVDLQENGDAVINERWEVNNTDGTEWFKPMESFAEGQTLEDFQVSVDGQPLEYNPNWNIDASFEEKAGTYGRNDSELNWGKTSMGDVTYDVSYRMSPLVLETEDQTQMIYWQFLNEGMDPAPNEFSVTVSSQVEPITDENYNIWGFGMEGPVEFTEEGTIHAYNTGELDDSSYMVLLTEIPAGTFSTPVSVSGNFAEWQERAFDGSDYGDQSSPFEQVVQVLVFVGTIIFGLFMIFVGVQSYKNSTKGKQRAIKKVYPPLKEESKNFDGEYFRQPVFDEVFESYTINKTLTYPEDADEFYDNYLTAGILELIRMGIIEVRSENDIDNFYLKERKPTLPTHLVQIYKLMEKGTDGRKEKIDLDLATKRFFRDGRDNTDKLYRDHESKLIDKQKEQGILKELKLDKKSDNKDLQKANRALGFALTDQGVQKREEMVKNYNYLKDFTLLDERGAFEVELWDELMLYAAAYGITEEVAKQIDKVFPGYWEKSEYTTYSPRVNPYTIFYLSRSMPGRVRSRNQTLKQQRQQRRTGGSGGGMSMGGGGGSFGGGMGGGSR